MTERQRKYLSALIEKEMVNTTRSFGGNPFDDRAFSDFFVVRLRKMMDTADVEKGSEMIDAVKLWSSGPGSVVRVVGASVEEMKAELAS